jgi:hypothetical protein
MALFPPSFFPPSALAAHLVDGAVLLLVLGPFEERGTTAGAFAAAGFLLFVAVGLEVEEATLVLDVFDGLVAVDRDVFGLVVEATAFAAGCFLARRVECRVGTACWLDILGSTVFLDGTVTGFNAGLGFEHGIAFLVECGGALGTEGFFEVTAQPRTAKTGFFFWGLALALASSLACCHSLSLCRRSLGLAETLSLEGFTGDIFSTVRNTREFRPFSFVISLRG